MIVKSICSSRPHHKMRSTLVILAFLAIWVCLVSASEDSPSITNIMFCEDVDESGNPVNPTEVFPSGTSMVTVWFEYENVPPSSVWGYRIYRGEDLVQIENYPIWGWYDSGSTHRDFIEKDGFADGTYILTFVINDEEVGSSSFTVRNIAEDEEFPETKEYVTSGSFGRIIFAEGATDESAPIGESDAFDAGITEIYMIIPYYGMTDGEFWSRKWLLDGEEIASTDEEWYEGFEGITYRYLYNGDGSPFSEGNYTVNLYLGDQVARSASFKIVGEGEKEEKPEKYTIEELVDPDLMKSYDILANSDNEALRILSTLVPEDGIKIRFSSDIPGTGQYRYSGKDDPGEIVISPDYWNEVTWEEVAGTIAHELTHALQRSAKGGTVKCTVENEYLAFLFEFYTLQESGRSDIIDDKFGGIFGSDGLLDKNKLWKAVKMVYSECPED